MGTELFVDINDLGIASVGAILLKSEAQNGNLGGLDGDIGLDELFHQVLCAVFAHAVIDAAACGDDLAAVAQLGCLIGQVIGVNTDAVTADQTGLEL